MTDAHPFEVFVRKYQNLVYSTAFRLLGSPTDAEDVAQTVFLRAFKRFDVIGSSPAAMGWLRTVTTNACLNHLTRYRRRWRFFSEMRVSDPERAEEAYEGRTPGSDDPAGQFERNERRRWLEEALNRLPDHQRVPLALFHFQDKTYADIATLLGVSVSKVKTDIHRGRLALKRSLQRAVGPARKNSRG